MRPSSTHSARHTVLAGLAATLLALSFQVTAQADRPSPLFGQWSVDVSRLPIPPQARPKSVTITFARAEAGALSTRVEVIDPTGGRIFAEGTAMPDGKAAAVKGNLEADVAATSMPSPGVLVMQLSRGGVPASTRIYAVSEDGQSMVETVAYFDQDGKPALRANYFSRIR